MTVHHLNLARPSPDRIIEANRRHRRDWFDAHCDYAATGDVVYRAERLAHEQSDDDPTGAMAAVVWLLGGIAVVGTLYAAFVGYCLLLAWTGGISL